MAKQLRFQRVILKQMRFENRVEEGRTGISSEEARVQVGVKGRVKSHRSEKAVIEYRIRVVSEALFSIELLFQTTAVFSEAWAEGELEQDLNKAFPVFSKASMMVSMITESMGMTPLVLSPSHFSRAVIKNV